MLRILLLCACLGLLAGEEFELPGFVKKVLRDTPEHRIVHYASEIIADGQRFRCEMYLDRIGEKWILQQDFTLMRGEKARSVLSLNYDCVKRTQTGITVSPEADLSVNYTAPGFVTPAGEDIGELLVMTGFDGNSTIDVTLRRNQHGVFLPVAR
jgi:hypothetical protein